MDCLLKPTYYRFQLQETLQKAEVEYESCISETAQGSQKAHAEKAALQEEMQQLRQRLLEAEEKQTMPAQESNMSYQSNVPAPNTSYQANAPAQFEPQATSSLHSQSYMASNSNVRQQNMSQSGFLQQSSFETLQGHLNALHAQCQQVLQPRQHTVNTGRLKSRASVD